MEKAKLARNDQEETEGGDRSYKDIKQKGANHMVDEMLSKFAENLGIIDGPDGTARFYYRKVGSIDVKVLMKKMGFKGGPLRHPDIVYEINAWEAGLIDEYDEVCSRCLRSYSPRLALTAARRCYGRKSITSTFRNNKLMGAFPPTVGGAVRTCHTSLLDMRSSYGLDASMGFAQRMRLWATIGCSSTRLNVATSRSQS